MVGKGRKEGRERRREEGEVIMKGGRRSSEGSSEGSYKFLPKSSNRMIRNIRTEPELGLNPRLTISSSLPDRLLTQVTCFYSCLRTTGFPCWLLCLPVSPCCGSAAALHLCLNPLLFHYICVSEKETHH